MKKLLLITALLALPASAHAGWNTRFALPTTPLPKEMMGYWCYEDSKSKAGESWYSRTDIDHIDDKCEALEVRPDGWSALWDNCPFTKIEKAPNGAYLIYSYCEMLAEGDGHGIGKYFSEHMEYRIAENGQLVVTQIPET
jgi:hypothetical protein